MNAADINARAARMARIVAALDEGGARSVIRHDNGGRTASRDHLDVMVDGEILTLVLGDDVAMVASTREALSPSVRRYAAHIIDGIRAPRA